MKRKDRIEIIKLQIIIIVVLLTMLILKG